MRSRHVTRWLMPLFVLSLPALAAAAEQLSDAYAAILRGDYQAGRTLISGAQDKAAQAANASRLQSWLDHFEDVKAQRDGNRAETFAWQTEQAKAAAESPEKTYLALSFVAQSLAYAADEQAVGQEAWVLDLRRRALAEAEAALQQEKWRRAHAIYLMLQRVYEKDEEIRDLRQRAARHARLEALYDKADAVERRMKGVRPQLLKTTVELVSENYYQEPEFRKMAEGALDALTALVTTTHLYDGPKASPLFDGVSNPASREHFLGRISDLKGKLPQPETYGDKDLLKLYEQVSRANSQSVQLPEELLTIEFTEGALSKLDDFTSVVWPADAVEFDKVMVGEFFGVGIQLGVDDLTNRLKVVTPLENSPALRAGIQPDDLIIEVDGESTSDWDTDKAIREIIGQEGTQVRLTMFRPSTGERVEYPLTRSRIQLTTIRGVRRADDRGERWDYMLDKDAGIAYVKLTGFNPDSHEQLAAALRDAKTQGMKGLVLDLRNNPGGLLDVAVETVSLFQREGSVVSTRGRREPRQELDVIGEPEFQDLPLMVLINDGSASASEILAGALQAHGRAVVLGERSFGKGSVQRVLMLERALFRRDAPAARLKLTTALYYLPDGRSPHRANPEAETWGVDPDWSVELTPKEFVRVIEKEREAYIIHNEAKKDTPVDEKKIAEALEALKAEQSADEKNDEPLLTAEDIEKLRADPHKAPDLDPQLEVALLQMRVRLTADRPWPQLAQRMMPVPNP